MNKHKDSEAARERRIDGEASEWIARKFRGFTAPEQDAFFEWLAADPDHSEAYVRYQNPWSSMDSLAEWMPEHCGGPQRDLLKDRQSVYRRFLWLGGVAASVGSRIFLRSGAGGEISRSSIEQMRFGLVPFWAKDEKVGY